MQNTSAGADQQKRTSVLFVEDDPVLIKMYQTKLVNEGFRVVFAENGIDGLAALESEDVDIIILDIMMPQLSGVDMLSRLRKTPKGKNIPVIILTNLTVEEEHKKAIELGVVDYIIKSNLTPTELVERIRKYTN